MILRKLKGSRGSGFRWALLCRALFVFVASASAVVYVYKNTLA